MKLKKWVQAILFIISIIALINMLLTDLEENIIPFCIHGLIFIGISGIISEFGTIYDEMIWKIEKLLNK